MASPLSRLLRKSKQSQQQGRETGNRPNDKVDANTRFTVLMTVVGTLLGAALGFAGNYITMRFQAEQSSKSAAQDQLRSACTQNMRAAQAEMEALFELDAKIIARGAALPPEFSPVEQARISLDNVVPNIYLSPASPQLLGTLTTVIADFQAAEHQLVQSSNGRTAITASSDPAVPLLDKAGKDMDAFFGGCRLETKS